MKIAPRGEGGDEFRRIWSLKSFSVRLPLNSCGTYNFSPSECRYGILSQSGLLSALTRSQRILLGGGGKGEGRENREREEKALLFSVKEG